MSFILKLLKGNALLILCLLAVIYLFKQTVELNQVNAKLQDDKDGLIDIIDHKNSELLELSAHYEQNEQLLLAKQAQLSHANALMQERQKQLEKLANENKDLKNWLDSALPADIKRLYQRNQITTSQTYSSDLSARQQLFDKTKPLN